MPRCGGSGGRIWSPASSFHLSGFSPHLFLSCLITTYTMDLCVTEVASYLICFYLSNMCFTEPSMVLLQSSNQSVQFSLTSFALLHFSILLTYINLLSVTLTQQHPPISGLFTLALPFTWTPFSLNYQQSLTSPSSQFHYGLGSNFSS